MTDLLKFSFKGKEVRSLVIDKVIRRTKKVSPTITV